jgi:hypothetical protein
LTKIIQALPGWIGLDHNDDDGIWWSGTVIAWGFDDDFEATSDPTPLTEWGSCEYVVSPQNVVVHIGLERWPTIRDFLKEQEKVETATRLMLTNRVGAPP